MNAVIYARYSTDSQREESIEGQLRECKEFAQQKGLKIVSTYIDRAFSAKTDDRPEFKRMIKDSGKRLFEVVIVWKLDRFARSRTDSAMNKFILKKNGVRVVSAKENISDGPEGIILEAMLEGYAEYYSAELSQKIIRGMTENALKGKYTCGLVPLGYKLDSEKYFQIDELTAPIVQEIYTRYADGETVAEITHSLNERALVTAKGAQFNKNSLHKMLKNRKYIGEYQYRDIVNNSAIPPIITEELFDKVQKRLEKNKKAPAAKKAVVEYLLTTKLLCGKCGAYMVGESGISKTGRTYNYYKCAKAKRGKGCKKKTIKKDFIERFVVEYTHNHVLQDDMISKLADSIVEVEKRENITLPHLHQQLKEVEKSIENMLKAIEQGVLTSSTKRRLDELEERQQELEISIAQEQIEKPPLTKEQLVFWISRFKDGDIDDPKHRRDIVDIFVNSLYLYDDKLVLTFNYTDGTETVSLDEISDILADYESSDLVDLSPPKTQSPCLKVWALRF
jgi:site-specific DNA recombinase